MHIHRYRKRWEKVGEYRRLSWYVHKLKKFEMFMSVASHKPYDWRSKILHLTDQHFPGKLSACDSFGCYYFIWQCMGYFVEYTWVLPKYGRTVCLPPESISSVNIETFRGIHERRTLRLSFTLENLYYLFFIASVLCGCSYKIGYEHGKHAKK